MLAKKHKRNACSLSSPSDHVARGVPTQDSLARTPLWSTMMKVFPSRNEHWDPKQANGNNSGQLALSPQALICPPLLSHHPMVTSLLDRRKVIIRPMKDGDGKRTFELGTIVTMSCHPWDSNAKKKNPPNPPQQDSPIQCIPCKQTLQQPTPGPSGTQWSEDLFHKPSQHDEPPIPGPSRSSKPPEDDLTCEPEPEVAPTQFMEEPFGKSQPHFFNSPLLCPSPACPATPHSVIIIDDTPVRSPLPDSATFHSYPGSFPRSPSHCHQEPNCLLPPVPSSSYSYNDTPQELTDLRRKLMIPQTNVHKAIN
ncbi:hypothetical protein O181_089862 [Austropuccinia psidii MF-1]|uniref:Uncharacterized protein n=1 Tax=Austropuccinia psidii MF-1 TaxID=1389203 RepID=A0A9Q3P750_9BASI|nr:hypothetical protein [Austropuccinia psidii MF-1]